MVNPSNQRDRRAIQGPETYNTTGARQNLSRECKTTTTLGRITPIFIDPTLPGDEYTIRTEVFTRFAPLILPIMHRVLLKVNYFYTPYRILWMRPLGWEEFITQNETLVQPYFQFDTNFANLDSSLGSYLGLPRVDGLSVAPLVKNLLCYPIAAFYMIIDEYFRNPQLTPEYYQPLTAGLNIAYNALAIAPPPPDLWNRDYFTSALPQPLAGDDILMPLVHDNFEAVTSYGTISPLGPFRVKNVSDDLPPTAGAVTTDAAGIVLRGASNPVYLDIQETAPSIRQLRVAARLYEFMEHLNRSSVRYRDFIKGMFNIDPDAGVVDRPQWIGGFGTQVVISEVLSQAAPESGLGAYAGQALAGDNGRTINYFCQEHGLIIGTLVIKPMSGYMNGINRLWTRFEPLDYPFVEFAGIGDQAILGQELHFEGHLDYASYNTSDWGYVQRFFDWKYTNDLVTGEMRDIWKNFHLARMWDQGDSPALNTEFVQCVPRTSDVFQVAAGEDEIYIYCYHHVSVNRRLPATSIGRL